MSNRYLREYDGYLKQHLGLIESLHRAGADNITIADRLYDLGMRAQSSSPYFHPLTDEFEHVRNLAAMVGYIHRRCFGWKQRTPLHFWADV